jgi:hypothetical protein
LAVPHCRGILAERRVEGAVEVFAEGGEGLVAEASLAGGGTKRGGEASALLRVRGSPGRSG